MFAESESECPCSVQKDDYCESHEHRESDPSIVIAMECMYRERHEGQTDRHEERSEHPCSNSLNGRRMGSPFHKKFSAVPPSRTVFGNTQPLYRFPRLSVLHTRGWQSRCRMPAQCDLDFRKRRYHVALAILSPGFPFLKTKTCRRQRPPALQVN
jgi:hypothetical protein